MSEHSPPSRHNPRGRFVLRLITAIFLIASAAYIWYRAAEKPAAPPPSRTQPVRAASVPRVSVPMRISALGTVTPENTVTVRSRVDGQLMALHFEEGGHVNQGDPLAEIDPRPYEVQRKQAQGALARDTALLTDARKDLVRYRKLIREQSVSAQQLQAQEALVGQYEGAVLMDEAAIADAELQLTYCKITAPVSGLLGLRRVDLGNMIRSSDTDGLVVIAQMKPMQVVFTLVEKQLPEVRAAMREPTPLVVDVYGQDNKTLLARGRLVTIDNQIDTSTGTVKAKAVFANDDEALFPNQFVNVRLQVSTIENALVVPTAAIQRNNQGFFVYVVENGKARIRPVTTGYATADRTVILTGVSEGEQVITDGVDRLRDNTEIVIRTGQTGEQERRAAPKDAKGQPDDAPGGGKREAPDSRRGKQPEKEAG